MTTRTSYQTPTGKTVVVEIVTETPNLADRNVTNACWDLRVTVDGEPVHGGVELAVHPKLGRHLRSYVGNVWTYVAPEHMAEVESILSTYRAEADRRRAQRRQAEADYQTRRERVLKALAV